MFNSFFDNESNILDEDEDENMRWSNENDSNDPETLECDITEAEEYEAIRILKNGKAPGPNWLIGEFFKNSAILTSFFLLACTQRTGQKQLPNLYLRKVIWISLIITEAFLSWVSAANYTATF